MNKKSSLYIDVDKAEKWGIIAKVSVYLNGKKMDMCGSAKSGKDGFVECLCENNRRNYLKAVRLGYWPTKKKRGNVQIKIKPA